MAPKTRDESANTTSSRRRPDLKRRIDHCRVRLWYCWLDFRRRTRSGSLERQLIPQGFRGKDQEGDWKHRNRMRGYRKGLHVPRPDLVEAAEALFPGSNAILNHVYWQIIDPEQGLEKHRASWLAALGPETQLALTQPTQKAIGAHYQRRSISRRILRRLENLGSLDALAATALLVREAQEEGNEQLAFQCARSAWALLLLISSTLPFDSNAPVMTALLGDALLDHVHYRGEQVSIRSAPIHVYERILREHCLRREDAGKLGPSWACWVRERLKLIHGKMGLDLLFALSLPTEATSTLRADPARHLRFQEDRIVRWKSLNYILDWRWSQRSFIDDWIAFSKDPNSQWPELDSQVENSLGAIGRVSL